MFRNQARKSQKISILSQQSSPKQSASNNLNPSMEYFQAGSSIHSNFNEFAYQTPPLMLEKTRTFSHKKLTLTSVVPSPSRNNNQNDGTVRKVIIPTFEVSKFYKNSNNGLAGKNQQKVKKMTINGNSGGNTHTYGIGTNNINYSIYNANDRDDGKISLKVSNAIEDNAKNSQYERSRININGAVISTTSIGSNLHQQQTEQMSTNSNANMSINEIQGVKKQLQQQIQQKCQCLLLQLSSQSLQIRQLQQHMQNINKQLQAKDMVIKKLQQGLHYNKNNHIGTSSHLSVLENRMSAIEQKIKRIQASSRQLALLQYGITAKVDTIIDTMNTSPIPAYSNISVVQQKQNQQPLAHKKTKSIFVKSTMQPQNLPDISGLTLKLQSCLASYQYRLTKLQGNAGHQRHINQIYQNYCQINNKIGVFGYFLQNFKQYKNSTQQQLQKFRQNHYTVQKGSQQKQKTADTKDSINYWQSLQDFIANQNDSSQNGKNNKKVMQNLSIFASDDYFFHPETPPLTSITKIGRNNSKQQQKQNQLLKSLHPSKIPMPSPSVLHPRAPVNQYTSFSSSESSSACMTILCNPYAASMQGMQPLRANGNGNGNGNGVSLWNSIVTNNSNICDNPTGKDNVKGNTQQNNSCKLINYNNIDISNNESFANGSTYGTVQL